MTDATRPQRPIRTHRPLTIQQREELVLGHGPRIAPLQPDELNEDLLKIVMRMITINAAVDAREPDLFTDLVADHGAGATTARMTELLAQLPEIVSTMLRHPKLFATQTEIGIQLLGHDALLPRERELTILRVGWLCQAPYEWGEHVLIAKSVGVSGEEIERVTVGASAAGWSDRERAILKAVDELYEDAMISDATWQTLSTWLDDKQLIELPILVGQYQTVAYYQNSFRLRLHSGNRGLESR